MVALVYGWTERVKMVWPERKVVLYFNFSTLLSLVYDKMGRNLQGKKVGGGGRNGMGGGAAWPTCSHCQLTNIFHSLSLSLFLTSLMSRGLSKVLVYILVNKVLIGIVHIFCLCLKYIRINFGLKKKIQKFKNSARSHLRFCWCVDHFFGGLGFTYHNKVTKLSCFHAKVPI